MWADTLVRMQGNLVQLRQSVASKADFPLPTLGPKLQAICHEVSFGRGFQLIRYASWPEFCKTFASTLLHRGAWKKDAVNQQLVIVDIVAMMSKIHFRR